MACTEQHQASTGVLQSCGGLNRSAVGETDVSFTSRRPQQLAPSTLTSPCLYQRAMPCYSQAWLRLVAGSVRFFTSRSSSTLPKTRPLPIYSIYIKAKAVPVAASSSELVSAGPTRSELRPRSLTALRIQLSSEDVHEDSVPTLPEVGEERPSGCRVNGLSSRKPQAAVRKTYL